MRRGGGGSGLAMRTDEETAVVGKGDCQNGSRQRFV
jgi:hypothetical protein